MGSASGTPSNADRAAAAAEESKAAYAKYVAGRAKPDSSGADATATPSPEAGTSPPAAKPAPAAARADSAQSPDEPRGGGLVGFLKRLFKR